MLIEYFFVPLGFCSLPVLSACEIEDRVITSPNSDYIPLPPWHSHDVRVRSNQRFGHDDFTLWPQFYTRKYDYLTAIPLKPKDSQDPLSLMWLNLSTDDFTPHPDSTIKGFGCLLQSRHAEFEAMRVQLMDRVQKCSANLGQLPVKLMSKVKTMNHTCIRMSETSTTIQEMQFTVVEFQRYYLEVRAMLDWHELFEPKLRWFSTANRTHVPVADTIGAFTTSADTAAQLYFAGLRVFLIHNHKLDVDIKPHLRVDYLPPSSLVFDDSNPPHPTIYRTAGSEEDSEEKIDQILRYSRVWMFYDPESSVGSEGLDLIPNASHLITMQHLIASRRALEQQPPPSQTIRRKPSCIQKTHVFLY